MKTFLNSLLFLVFLVPSVMWSQTTVSGTVTDQASAPLPGVNILIKGTTTGTTTDWDGNYSISAKNGDIVVFSYVGFKPQEFNYTGQQSLNVVLIEDTALLDEIVLIGYGSTTKQDATGSVEKVSEKEFNQGAIVSPEQLLAGKSAGVRITSSGGDPGGGSDIRIRGGASLSANNSPLIVIDGLPLDQRGVQGVRNQLNAINPTDIEDFVVLKDASATAIYGSRASNGVILITTKKGKTNAPLTVEYDLKASVAQVTDYVDVLSASEFRTIAEADTNFNENLLGNSSTDWQKQIYQTAVGAIHNVTVSQGFENFNFRANVNHTSQQGVLTGDLYERNSVNLSAVQRLFDNNLKLTLTTKGILDDNKYADKGAIGAAIGYDPTHSVYNEDGSYFQYVGQNLALVNPVFSLDNNNNRARNTRNISNFNVDYNMPFLDGLKFNLNAGLDYSEISGKEYRLASPTNPGSFNYQNFYTGFNRNTLLDFYFNYKKNLSSLNTNVDLTAGHSYQEFYIKSDRRETETSGGLVPRATIINRNALESYFARASFDIANRYLLSLTVRRDGSSRFGEENRWSTFPGVSAGWKISNEDFLQNSVISNLKLRAGWGKTGQQEIGQNYGYLGVYTPGRSDASVQFGYINGVPQFVNTLRPEEFDENLKWEETSQYNVALDFGLFDERLTGTVDAYYRETTDLLATIPTAAGSNLSDLLTTNVGSVLSKGIEFSLNGALAQSEDFNWDMAFNVTLQENKITKLSLGTDPNFFIAQGGISGGTGNNIQLWREGLDPSTFYVFRQVYDTAGQPIEGAYVDVNGDNQITEADKQAYKKASPDAYLGFTNTLNYKNLDFSFTFRGSLGNYMYNNVASDRGNVTTVNDAPGQYYVNAHSSVLDNNFQKQNLFSDYYIERADFVKLDNVSLGYLVPGEKIDLRLSLTATNLFTITKYDGLDPEISNGIDNNFYPRPKTYVLGLNFTF
ncbi:SusC/RagA family TonB-linked outer membrane protein [Gelidibacter salicanalis]|uniref:SusC/RagA family TonB-linked outer membrane protein n=1 Tax=Gelidibacter salicanalis TaxID=291193 RepID=A0A5C7ANL8_9FLAO|nr:SusC/RagA family TonB-linked outer membrane protein [Gelidibacter salicanalis]TXE09163.1 SusC/RagA family TonB-linked outer membrane protein [Gelidibacter salicanalis]